MSQDVEAQSWLRDEEGAVGAKRRATASGELSLLVLAEDGLHGSGALGDQRLELVPADLLGHCGAGPSPGTPSPHLLVDHHKADQCLLIQVYGPVIVSFVAPGLQDDIEGVENRFVEGRAPSQSPRVDFKA
jgi:hypothetical protein